MENIKKKASVKLPARASIWGVISGLVSRGVGVVGTPIFTRLLTPAEYGLYPLYTTWLSLFSVIATMGLTGSALYRGFQKYSGMCDRFLSASLGLMLTAFGGIFLIGAPLSGVIIQVSGLPIGILLLLASEAMLSAVIALGSAKYRYEYKYKSLAFINIISAVGTPSISVAFVTLTPYHAEARILGSLVTTLAIAIPQLCMIVKRGNKLFDMEIWRYLVRVNIPLLPHYVASSLILRVSEMVIGRTHGQEALGKYSVALSVGLALTVLTNALGQVFSPWILRKLATKNIAKVRDCLFLASLGLMAVSLLVLSVAPEILSVITPPEYHDALPAVYPLAMSVSAMFISNAVISGEAYYEKSAKSAFPTVITAAVSTGVALLFLPRVDYRFSAVFTLIAYILLAIFNIILFKRLSGENILHIRKTAIAFSLSISYAILTFLLRAVLLSRILLALPLLPLLFMIGRRVWIEIKE